MVDASVFPRIPGFFIVTAIYMAAEKASAVIAARPSPPAAGRVRRAAGRPVPTCGSVLDLAAPPAQARPPTAPAVQENR